jgi:hypothetical protein
MTKTLSAEEVAAKVYTKLAAKAWATVVELIGPAKRRIQDCCHLL